MSGPKEIVAGAWLVSLGVVNSVLIQGDDGELALFDTGFPDHEEAIFEAIEAIGRKPEELDHLVLTHAHPDHIGSAAAVVARTGATTWMHPVDIPVAEAGGPFRPMKASPGIPQKILFRIFWRPGHRTRPVAIDRQMVDGEILPIAGGLRVIHAPGHSAGQVSLSWLDGRLMIVGDVGSNMMGVADPLGFEDRAEGRRSQRRLASLDFGAAAFGHGKAITEDASTKIRRRWGS